MKEKHIGKVLKDGESTFRNGAGGLCGGIVKKSVFDKDPMGYMMAYYMEDKMFNKYVLLKENGKDKEATEIFKKYAKSAI